MNIPCEARTSINPYRGRIHGSELEFESRSGIQNRSTENVEPELRPTFRRSREPELRPMFGRSRVLYPVYQFTWSIAGKSAAEGGSYRGAEGHTLEEPCQKFIFSNILHEMQPTCAAFGLVLRSSAADLHRGPVQAQI